MPPSSSPPVQELFSAALWHHRAGRLAEAEGLYRQSLQIDPAHADALHFLGVIAQQRGHFDAAVDLIRQAIAQNPNVAAFHNNLGNVFGCLGRFEEAVTAYGRALGLKPDLIGAQYNIGIARQAQGRFEEAGAAYDRVLILQPDHAEALSNLGNVRQAQGKLAEAVRYYERALQLKPHHAEAHNNLGNVLKAQGEWQRAEASLHQALALKPDFAEAHANLGMLLLEQGRFEPAQAALEHAVVLKPQYAEAHHYRANALRELGRAQQALAAEVRALDLAPDFAAARLGLATAGIPLLVETVAESEAVVENFSQALEPLAAWSRDRLSALGAQVGSQQPFYLAYRPSDVTAPLCRYGEVVGAAATAHWRSKTAALRTVRVTRARLRLAVVSAQVRRHPVWDVILRGLIAHLDRTRFEIHLYHTGHLRDAETAWAASHVDAMLQGPKSPEAWLEQIVRDRPDVMFYPEVGMDPISCALAAVRLAPLQVAAWGHPVTTGLPHIDLFVSGELLEGPRADNHYRERLVRLPGTGVFTQWTSPGATRWRGAERDRDVARFALCQQPVKFDPADDALIARIAKHSGPSEFWLVRSATHPWATAKLCERLAAAFRDAGLDPDAHLRVTPWLSREEFSGFLDDMDLYLDCPAFSGYTSAWQALHRGLPVITLEGEFLRQRLAGGLLRSMGHTESIAASREQYVERAASLAQTCRQRATWTEHRAALQQDAGQTDGQLGAVRAFEQTLLEAFQRP